MNNEPFIDKVEIELINKLNKVGFLLQAEVVAKFRRERPRSINPEVDFIYKLINEKLITIDDADILIKAEDFNEKIIKFNLIKLKEMKE